MKDDDFKVGPVFWRDLRAHAARQGLFLVAPDLELREAARAIADDDVSRVQTWIETGKLTRPTETQLTAWDADLDTPFVAAVVQPFALAQPA